MYSINTLTISRILRVNKGVIVYATYPSWEYEFTFFVQNDGRVMGKTTLGFWEEISAEMAKVICAKVKLKNNASLRYKLN